MVAPQNWLVRFVYRQITIEPRPVRATDPPTGPHYVTSPSSKEGVQMARSSVPRALLILLALGLLALPTLAHADYFGWRTGYRETAGWYRPYTYSYSYIPVSSVPGVGIVGAPLHGIVCVRGTIAELPVERQGRYIDGSTVGQPGYRCLDFQH